MLPVIGLGGSFAVEREQAWEAAVELPVIRHPRLSRRCFWIRVAELRVAPLEIGRDLAIDFLAGRAVFELEPHDALRRAALEMEAATRTANLNF